MPNGDYKNWTRFCAAVDGFRGKYGVWPTRVRLFQDTLNNLQNEVFSSASFAELQSKLELIADDAPIVAEDDEGRSYSYGAEGFPKPPSDERAAQWLGIKPDRESH